MISARLNEYELKLRFRWSKTPPKGIITVILTILTKFDKVYSEILNLYWVQEE